MIHPCECKAYNGGQCYNCLNGAHDLCAANCKVKRSKQVGLMLVFKQKRFTTKRRVHGPHQRTN